MIFRFSFSSDYLTNLNCYMLSKYPIPMKKETQGLTDVYIGNWLKSRPRDQVYFSLFSVSLYIIILITQSFKKVIRF